MKNISRHILLVLICFSIASPVLAEKSIRETQSRVKKNSAKAAGDRCRRAQGSTELNINNVRARINSGGTMWFDGSVARYAIPANGTASSLYCGSLWIGGTDGNGQLRLAAMRFGQSGDDFWPGPLTIDGTAYTEASDCNEYDKHFKVNKAEIENFVALFNSNNGSTAGIEDHIPEIVKNWPAHGNTGKKQSYYLAPFYDMGEDGEYNWEDGDYPYYDFENALCPKFIKSNLPPGVGYNPKPSMESDSILTSNNNSGVLLNGGMLVDQVLKGDQTLWWIMNDKGNTHTESEGEPIGLEIRAQAFAFATNDEINNMTFYSYEIINRSTYVLNETYFSQWVDADLGYAQDDYVGCDVGRGLGYCYNGKNIDGPGVGAYSGNPPAVGIDFFQGPYMDPDGKDNPKINIDSLRNSGDSIILMISVELGGYSIFDAQGNFIKYDTIRLTEDADRFKGSWYFKKDDVIGNCGINGVNFGNLIIDDERFGMRRFVYYNNDVNPVNGEPNKAQDYYNYLRGYWRNGQRMTYGGAGFNQGGTPPVCDFMFPGTTDTWGWGTNGEPIPDHIKADPRGWTEESSQNAPGDRRFMQSAGPFTLKPGAVNYITVGIPWAQASSASSPYASVELLKQVDDKCQALFDNCFKLIDGPDAPSLTISPQKNKLILFLSYDNESSNNYNERYQEIDNTIEQYHITSVIKDTIVYIRDTNEGNPIGLDTIKYEVTEEVRTPYDRNYLFEGYQIYQLKNNEVSINEINDPNKAKLVIQCDIENHDKVTGLPINKLVNYTRDNQTGGLVGEVKVDGANKGVKHSFEVTEDLFAAGINKTLLNNKEYYYIAIAYAHNNFRPYSQTNSDYLDGQKTPYLIGRKREIDRGQITPVMAMPADPITKNGGSIVQSAYGESPEITRIHGYGNGGMLVDLEQAEIDALLQGGVVSKEVISYKRNYGPVNVKVVDPLSLQGGEFIIQFDGISDTAHWVLTKKDGSALYIENGVAVNSIVSDHPMGYFNEQLILPLGISLSIESGKTIATDPSFFGGFNRDGGNLVDNPLLASSMTFSDPTKPWLLGVNDNDAMQVLNWIRSGEQFAAQKTISDFKTEDSISPVSYAEYLAQDYYAMLHGKGASANGDSIPAKMRGIDPNNIFEKVINGTWAPYRLVSTEAMHPGFSLSYYLSTKIIDINRRKALSQSENTALIFNDLNNLASVKVVYTADKSKWTRCPVLEMSDNYLESEGNARKFQLRKSKSVNKEGEPIEDGQFPNGMGWFPGYAINMETGERLNMMFGEDSRFPEYNGSDMMWNPSNTLVQGSEYVFGGRHYVYILGNSTFQFKNFSDYGGDGDVPGRETSRPYDEGVWAYERLKTLDSLAAKPLDYVLLADKLKDSAAIVFASVMWVHMPLGSSDFVIDNPSNIPCDLTFQINVRKPYGVGYNPNSENKDFPQYQFTIADDFKTIPNVASNPQSNFEKDKMKSILDKIKVIPNPYYNRSQYEGDKINTQIRITELLRGSVVSIYSLDGTLVKKLTCPPSQTFVVWDLLNHSGQHIAGGLYLIHVNIPNVGEKIIRWFGSMRPEDINSFPLE